MTYGDIPAGEHQSQRGAGNDPCHAADVVRLVLPHVNVKIHPAFLQPARCIANRLFGRRLEQHQQTARDARAGGLGEADFPLPWPGVAAGIANYVP